MGLQVRDILVSREIALDGLAGRVLAVDSFNLLYQFLATIRQPDGTPLQDSHGRVTSHLAGLFSRSANLLQKGIRLAFVFDGEPPALKQKERDRRAAIKRQAERQYEVAREHKDVAGMKKFAARTGRLTGEMIEEAKVLVAALGCPVIQAPSEGEAQAAHIVRNGHAYASVSQDFDSMLYGATLLVRNLSVVGRRKIAGGPGYASIKPELINLAENLNRLGIDNDQLIAMAMLIGTDYNIGGIKGLGPKKALELVKRHGKDFEKLFAEAGWDRAFDTQWNEVYYLIKQMPVTNDYALHWGRVDRNAAIKLLCTEHDFSEERVLGTLDKLDSGGQRGLRDFF